MTRKKLIEYIPAMLITNLSTLLLISVDGLVVGNLVGGKALSAVNIFSPATLLIGVISAMIASVQGSLRPLMGLMIGSKDHDGTRLLLRQGLSFVTIFVSIIVVIIELFPGMFYHFHGINDIPDGGELSLRLFAVSFLFAAFNTIFRLYYSNRKDTGFSSTLTVVGHAAIPLLAFILTRFLPGPFLWLGNLIAELIILAFNMKRYTYWLNKDIAEQDKDEKTFYLTVTPDKAVEASQMIQSFAKENGCSAGIAYRVALCMEEMVAYIEASGNGAEIDTQIIVRFLHDSAHFIIIDNGRCIVLDDNPESQELITNNYALIKKMAKSVMVNEDSKILAAYEAMQQAMIDKYIDKLDRIAKDGTTFTHMSGKTQTKEEYFGEIADGTLNYYKYKITDCKITVNGVTATLTANVTLTAKVYGMSGSWTLPVNAHFEKINKKTFYHYYETLDFLLAEMQAELSAGFLERIKDYVLPDDLDKVNREFFLYASEQGLAYEKITCGGSYHAIRDDMTDKVNDAAWSNSKKYHKLSDYEKKVLMGFINNAVLNAYREWVQDGKKISMDEVIEITNKLVLGGVKGFFKK